MDGDEMKEAEGKETTRRKQQEPRRGDTDGNGG
jgi:hypothetical protein